MGPLPELCWLPAVGGRGSDRPRRGCREAVSFLPPAPKQPGSVCPAGSWRRRRRGAGSEHGSCPVRAKPSLPGPRGSSARPRRAAAGPRLSRNAMKTIPRKTWVKLAVIIPSMDWCRTSPSGEILQMGNLSEPNLSACLDCRQQHRSPARRKQAR